MNTGLRTLRSQGERIRIAAGIQRMRATLDAIEKTLDIDSPPSPDVAQAVAHSGSDLASSIARLEAYMRAEADDVTEANRLREVIARAHAHGATVESRSAFDVLDAEMSNAGSRDRKAEE